jgi:transcriptional regulator with XRE-family HTH domain
MPVRSVNVGPELRAVMLAERERQGYTQAELGSEERYGHTISTETISKLETGRAAKFSIDVVTVLALRLGISPERIELLDGGYHSVAARMRRITIRDKDQADAYARRVFRGRGED